MRIPENNQYVLFGGSFILSNKLQWVADKKVDGLSTKQWFLLRTLQDMPVESTPTITSLAKETDTTRQNVTKMLEVLCRQGHIVLKNNPHDHRSRIVEMTGLGRQMLSGLDAKSVSFFEELFTGISAEECGVAAKVTILLIENLLRMQAVENALSKGTEEKE